jgi:hypothetical protein
MDHTGMMAPTSLIVLRLCEIHDFTSIPMVDGLDHCLALNMHHRRTHIPPDHLLIAIQMQTVLGLRQIYPHQSISILHNKCMVNLEIPLFKVNNRFWVIRCTTLHKLLGMQFQANHIQINSNSGCKTFKPSLDLPPRMDNNATRLLCGLFNSIGSCLHTYITQDDNSKLPDKLMARPTSYHALLSTLNRPNYPVLATRSMVVGGNLSQSRRKSWKNDLGVHLTPQVANPPAGVPR